MTRHLINMRLLRKAIIASVSELSPEQMNRVPQGFNNNIIWNLSHLTASQQVLCYVKTGLDITIDKEFVEQYQSGTKPQDAAGIEQIAQSKELLLSAIDRFEKDYDNHVFDNYQNWANRYGIELTSIEEVIQYVMFHDGLHYGYIMALKRCLPSS